MTKPRRRLEWRYTLGDQSWTLDLLDLTLDDYVLLRQLTGYSYVDLMREHDQGDALAVKACWWMARRRTGETKLEFTDASLSPRMADFRREIVRPDPEEAPDPSGSSEAEPPPTSTTT